MSAVTSHSSGFINHARFAFAKDPNVLLKEEDRGYEKNRMEQAGDRFAWHVVELPKLICEAFENPKIVTVALTALALFSVQLTFYPIITAQAIKASIIFASNYVPFWSVKMGAYLATQAAVLGFGMRALGRFSNDDLMAKWYRT